MEKLKSDLTKFAEMRRTQVENILRLEGIIAYLTDEIKKLEVKDGNQKES